MANTKDGVSLNLKGKINESARIFVARHSNLAIAQLHCPAFLTYFRATFAVFPTACSLETLRRCHIFSLPAWNLPTYHT
jgi:hypothetical protein